MPHLGTFYFWTNTHSLHNKTDCMIIPVFYYF